MKRILYLANLHPNKLGSIEEHALFLARELRRRGYECFMGFIAEPDAEIAALFRDAGAQVLTVHCGETAIVGGSAVIKIREILALRRVVIRYGIDLVHINFMGLTNPALLGVYLTRAKIIFTEHASGFPFRRGALKNLASRMIHTPLRMRISRYVGVSKYVVNRLKLTHHVSEQQATTIYNGVNIARFVGRDRATTRATLGIPINAKVVCAVAMLIPEKGIQHLFDATALLVEQYGQTDIRLLVVGEGAYRRELEQQVIRTNISPYVMFLGRRSDVHDIVAASDVIAVPCTWEESFGLIIAEAMAGSRPVVASRTGGIPELVDHGLTGLLVTPGKSRELAASLHRLLTDSDEYRRMGEAGIEKARVMFDLEKQVVKLADLYDEIVEA